MRCPKCIEQNKKSIVYYENSRQTLMGHSFYYDEDGNPHDHNPNNIRSYYNCSNEHSFMVTKTIPCPTEDCEWNLKESEITIL